MNVHIVVFGDPDSKMALIIFEGKVLMVDIHFSLRCWFGGE